MHGRSRMTIANRPSHPYNTKDGACRVSTDQADIAVHQARSGVRCPASRMKSELHASLRTTCEADFRTLCVRREDHYDNSTLQLLPLLSLREARQLAPIDGIDHSSKTFREPFPLDGSWLRGELHRARATKESLRQVNTTTK